MKIISLTLLNSTLLLIQKKIIIIIIKSIPYMDGINYKILKHFL